MKKKKIIIGIIIILIVFIVSLVFVKIINKNHKRTMKTTSKISYYNSNEGVVKKAQVEGLEIDNINLKLDKTKSTLTAYVKNTTDKDISLRIIYIHVKDKKGKKITTLRGYIGNTIKPNETKKITSIVNRNLKNAYSFEYELVKE